MLRNVTVIFHDNGIAGKRGYTEYSSAEVNSFGGIDALKADYSAHNITIFDIFTSTER